MLSNGEWEQHNSSFGYFAGGVPGPIARVDRVDYSNDTAQASPKGPLSAARDYGAASSRANANPTEISNITNYAAGTLATSHFTLSDYTITK